MKSFVQAGRQSTPNHCPIHVVTGGVAHALPHWVDPTKYLPSPTSLGVTGLSSKPQHSIMLNSLTCENCDSVKPLPQPFNTKQQTESLMIQKHLNTHLNLMFGYYTYICCLKTQWRCRCACGGSIKDISSSRSIWNCDARLPKTMDYWKDNHLTTSARVWNTIVWT